VALFIGIDLGTSGCRAIAIDEQGEIQGSAVTNLPAPIRINHGVEQDPALWWNAVCACLSDLTTRINSHNVIAIAVDGTSATLLLTDADGNPLGPAFMYNDARAKHQAVTIAQAAPANTAAQGASCALAKLLWFYQHSTIKEETLPKVRYALHQADWITAKLCNRFGFCDVNNSMKLGFDAEHNRWPVWLINLLNEENIPLDTLPEVVAPGTVVGQLTTELAQQLNLPTNTNIVAGTTDSTASIIATGATNLGDAVTALGSTLVLKVISDTPVFAPEFGVYSHPLINVTANNKKGQRWLVGGASNSGGAVLNQFFSTQQIQNMTPLLQPDTPTELNYYPLPANGERFPVNDIHKPPQLEPRPDNDVIFFQGILEGIAAIEARGYQLLTELGAPIPVTIRTTGGGAKNDAWTKIREIMLNREGLHPNFFNADHTEAAYGTALIARSKHPIST
jgi:sugar (pentulose or hexulose) kinase